MANNSHIGRKRAPQTPAAIPAPRHAFAVALAACRDTATMLHWADPNDDEECGRRADGHAAAIERLVHTPAPDLASLSVKFDTILAYHRPRDICMIEVGHLDPIARDLAALMNLGNAGPSAAAVPAAPAANDPATAFPRLQRRSLSPAHQDPQGLPGEVPPADLKIMAAFERWCSVTLAIDPDPFEATKADLAIWEAQYLMAKEIAAMPAAGVHGQAIKTWLALRMWFGGAGRGDEGDDHFAIDLPRVHVAEEPHVAEMMHALAKSCLTDSRYLAAALEEAAELAVLKPAA